MKLKLRTMKNNILENSDIKERVKKGLDMTFEKLLKTKSQTNGIFVLSQNGIIRKVKASDLHK
jgi:hypothetical protein